MNQWINRVLDRATGDRFFSAIVAGSLFLSLLSAQAEIANEWIFESEPVGLTLSQADNSGMDGAVFSAGGEGFLETDGQGLLLCVHEDLFGTGMWTNGALLETTVASITSGVRYLRCDLEYKLTSIANDSGALVGLTLTDGSGAKLAGFALEYDAVGTPAPTNLTVTEIGWLDNSNTGTVSVIARIDLSGQTMDVWYDATGSNVFDELSPDVAAIPTQLTSVDKLKFQATGDFQPLGTDNFVGVDNIRMAETWVGITAIIPDFEVGPILEVSSVMVTNASGSSGSDIGETNTVTVVLRGLGAPATNSISLLTPALHPDYFTIVSNGLPSTLAYGDLATNTFLLRPSSNAVSGVYTFDVSATADGATQVDTSFDLAVGTLVSYQSNTIAEVSEGVLSGVYEPGETIDITVFSKNGGATLVSNIVNSLSTDTSYFSWSNQTASLYSSLAVDATTSTVYRVVIDPSTPHGAYTFSVTNQSGSRQWSDTFLIDIFRQGIPSVSPGSVALNVLEGGVAHAEVIVTNSGNAAVTFDLSDNGAWDALYGVVSAYRGVSDFVAAYDEVGLNDPNTNNIYITPETSGVSDPQDLGFSFPFYGASYSNFYVTADGYIGLGTNAPATSAVYGAFPTAGGEPMIAPFWSSLHSPAGSIRTIRNHDYLVISYSGVSQTRFAGGTNLIFQVALYEDGRIVFRYKNIDGAQADQATVGLQGSTNLYQNVEMAPETGDSIALTSQEARWVSYSPSSTSVPPFSSVPVVFTANATTQTNGASIAFDATFSWSSGGSDTVAVAANVTELIPEYSARSTLSFSGAAGEVTSVPFMITNSGTGPLHFAISDDASAAAGYLNTNAPILWVNLDGQGTNVALIDPSPNPYITAADEGFSPMIPIGFTFPFYGSSYTQLSVNVNGLLRLDTTGRVFVARDLSVVDDRVPEQLIAPYWSDLALDDDASIRYRSISNEMVITWTNIRQYGLNGGSNLTFQAILRSNGDVLFQYKRLEGGRWPYGVIGLRDSTNHFVSGAVRTTNDWTLESYPISGATYTEYVDAVSNRVVRFQPAEVQVIGYTPSSGIVPADGTVEITVTGDASNQSVGLGSAVTNTTLTITHDAVGSSAAVEVTFAATNSQEAVFASALADDNDGDGLTDDEERIAGTDPQSADSVFAPSVIRTEEGTRLSWPAAQDGLPRVYTLYWATDLTGSWDELEIVTIGTTYLDAEHLEDPVVYYKVTVE